MDYNFTKDLFATNLGL